MYLDDFTADLFLIRHITLVQHSHSPPVSAAVVTIRTPLTLTDCFIRSQLGFHVGLATGYCTEDHRNQMDEDRCPFSQLKRSKLDKFRRPLGENELMEGTVIPAESFMGTYSTEQFWGCGRRA